MILDKATYRTTFICATLIMANLGIFLASPREAYAAQDVITTTSDETAVKQTIASLEKALATGSGTALSSLWTADGLYVDADGNTSRSRDAIEKRFDTVFKLKGPQLYELIPEAVRIIAPTAARADGIVKPKGTAGATAETRFLMLFTKENGQWLISSASEIPLTSAASSGGESLSIKDLDWLVGKWSAERDGNTVQLTAQWLPNKNFINCTYEIHKVNQPVQMDYQIIGWDPERDQLSSWSFLANGGTGTGRWFKRGGKWLVESCATEPDGSVSSAVNVIDPTNPSSFVFQSINRSINGIAVADSNPLKVERVSQ